MPLPESILQQEHFTRCPGCKHIQMWNRNSHLVTCRNCHCHYTIVIRRRVAVAEQGNPTPTPPSP
jgi:acetyl-CoA carboxylase beta subunit